MRNHVRSRLSQESQSDRIHRLNDIHERLSDELSEQRKHRLSIIRIRLVNETSEQREYRLNVIRDRLTNETPEQREYRLNVIRDRLTNETPEQREHRLDVIHTSVVLLVPKCHHDNHSPVATLEPDTSWFEDTKLWANDLSPLVSLRVIDERARREIARRRRVRRVARIAGGVAEARRAMARRAPGVRRRPARASVGGGASAERWRWPRCGPVGPVPRRSLRNDSRPVAPREMHCGALDISIL
ncbi:hypothetical protein EVAR_35630_1 [Eumeta japonica]|uniref:STPR domain-containing protein n=1 Tax=Eumeta variegata TaxID=151549 RepID=A0A4C1WC91_EUMVA|nr:hypothetical protein EVAR_35630_1 [Eumeta japonica]